MKIQVHYTRSWRKLWIIIQGRRGFASQNMYLNFGVAEEMIHYGLHHLRHDTEEGLFVLPKALRRLDPVKVLQDLFRRKMLGVDEDKLGPIKRKFHCPQVEFDLYWKEVYASGLYNLTPLGDAVLQAVKEFFLASVHGNGFLPLYSLEPEAVTPEWRKVIFDACDRWGFLAEFKLFSETPHVLVTPFKSTWWLRQFPRFEDRLHLLIPEPPKQEPPCPTEKPNPSTTA